MIKIKTLSYIRELSYPNNNLTRRLTALCEIEVKFLYMFRCDVVMCGDVW